MIIIKIGGVVATDTSVLTHLLTEIAALKKKHEFVLVHGGGKEVTAISEKFGYVADFRDGIRITSPQEMNVVDMVLGGKINIDLVRRAQAVGLNAVGLGGQDGRSFVSKALAFADKPSCRTGEVVKADAGLIKLLCKKGYFPILHSTSMDEEGRGLNINADEAAQEVAIAAQAKLLVYISDIAGVLKDGQVIPTLDKKTIEAEIASGVIGGGMIPKVKNALAAAKATKGQVVIGGYKAPGDLEKLIKGQAGTTIG